MSAPEAAWERRLLDTYPVHRAAFIAGLVALHAANLLIGEGWWAFWPTLAWSIVFTVHFLFAKSLAVDDRWVEERVSDLHYRSYDQGHIDNIADRMGPPKAPKQNRSAAPDPGKTPPRRTRDAGN